MKTDFDPYRKWLGIPPSEQPPNHYRLLGIGLYETDKDVISNAADRQMAHIRTFQTGKYSELSQKILNELSAARVTLLDAKQRAAYDEKLRGQLAEKPAEATVAAVKVVPVPVGGVAPPQPSAAPPVAPPAAPPQVLPSVPAPVSSVGAARGGVRKKKKDPTVMLAVLATVVIFLILLLVFAAQNGKNTSENGKPAPVDTSSRPKIASAPAKPSGGGNGNSHTPPPASRAKPDNSAEAAQKAAEMERLMAAPADEVEVVEEDFGMPGNGESDVLSADVTPEMLLYAAGGLFDSEIVPGREHTPLLTMEEMETLAAAGMETAGDSGTAPRTASTRKISKNTAAARNGIQLAQLTGGVKGMDYRKVPAKDDSPRNLYLKYYGGTEDTEKAVEAGLGWLESNQYAAKPSKFWNYNHSLLASGKTKTTSKGSGTLTAPVSATALALMGMLGAGNSPKTGKLRQPVSEGMKSLATAAQPVSATSYLAPAQLSALKRNKMQAAELNLAESSPSHLRAHAWSTIAFCEAFGLMRDGKPNDVKMYGEIALRLVSHILSRQTTTGGWPEQEAMLDENLYAPRSTTNSVGATVWNLMALKSAKDAQLPMKELERKLLVAQERAARYLREQMGLVDSRLRSTISATSASDWSADTLTPSGLATVRDCLLGLRLSGVKLTAKEESILESVAVTLLDKEPRVEDGMSNVMTALLVRDVDPEGWEAWNEKLRRLYIDAQETDRAELGSWYYTLPEHEELESGRLYCTALAILYLESYYRCAPMVGGR